MYDFEIICSLSQFVGATVIDRKFNLSNKGAFVFSPQVPAEK